MSYKNFNSQYYHLDFTNNFPDTITNSREIYFLNTNASSSDIGGIFQFCSNGIAVVNKENDTMFNSQNFNPGFGTNYYINSGMGIPQGAIALPFGNVDTNKYYLIYETFERFYNKDSMLDYQPFHLSYSIIDMTLDSGRGAIIPGFKNLHSVVDTLLYGRITACKHANGRDWWVVVHKYYSDIYYTLLFTPTGVLGPFTQQIGPILYPYLPNGLTYDWMGMACFSPDGTKYAMFGFSNEVELMDFDRCTGTFSNYRSSLVSDTTMVGLGCSFSPNSRFLYVNTYVTAFQYDTYASNLATSEIIVAQWDSFMNPAETYFFLNQLAPNGKIYIGTWNGNHCLHVIENADSIGMLCNFVQHNIALPPFYTTNISVPNFPNYRLGRLISSPCDTLTSIFKDDPPDINFTISPNPSNGNFIFSYTLPQNKNGTLQIFDVTGKQVYKQTLPQWSTMQKITLKNMASGVYTCTISATDKVQYKKLVVVK